MTRMVVGLFEPQGIAEDAHNGETVVFARAASDEEAEIRHPGFAAIRTDSSRFCAAD